MTFDQERINLEPKAGLGVTLTDGVSPLPRELPAAELGPIAPGDPDRYQVVQLLGAGGMGMVFEAHDRVLDRTVALKVVRAADGSDLAQSRLRLEARAMARLSHPNVTTLFDVVAVGDLVFLAMELVRGGTLRDLVGKARPWRDLLRLLLEAGRGLAAAHVAGVIHRDFKPDNVLVGDDGVARVADFGLASTGEATVPAPWARPGSVAGTLAYMAPERLAGAATAGSDQFAFCVTAFELLEGRRPFDITSSEASSPERFGELVAARRRPWTRLDIPARVRSILDLGMSLDPTDRWPDLGALLSALADAAASSDAQPARPEHRGGCRVHARTVSVRAGRTRAVRADARACPAARSHRASHSHRV